MIRRIAIFVCLAVLPGSAALAERVGVVGTRVLIEPPAGFVRAADFAGFVNPSNRAVISVSEVPASYLDMDKRFTDSALLTKELSVVSRELLEKDGLRAQLIKAEQKLGNSLVVKWMLLTGDVAESVIITASYLASAGNLDAAFEKALRDAVWESSQTLNHFEGLGFKLNEIPGLRISTRVSNTVIFTRDGRLPDQYYTGPMLIVRWQGLPDGAPEDARAHSEDFFRGIEMLKDKRIDDTIRTRVERLRGYEVIGEGRHRFLGYPVAVLQSIAYDDDRFFVAQGLGQAADREKHFDLFRTVIGTFTKAD